MEKDIENKEVGIQIKLKYGCMFIKNSLGNGIIVDFNGNIKMKNKNKITLISLKKQ